MAGIVIQPMCSGADIRVCFRPNLLHESARPYVVGPGFERRGVLTLSLEEGPSFEGHLKWSYGAIGNQCFWNDSVERERRRGRRSMKRNLGRENMHRRQPKTCIASSSAVNWRATSLKPLLRALPAILPWIYALLHRRGWASRSTPPHRPMVGALAFEKIRVCIRAPKRITSWTELQMRRKAAPLSAHWMEILNTGASSAARQLFRAQIAMQRQRDAAGDSRKSVDLPHLHPSTARSHIPISSGLLLDLPHSSLLYHFGDLIRTQRRPVSVYVLWWGMLNSVVYVRRGIVDLLGRGGMVVWRGLDSVRGESPESGLGLVESAAKAVRECLDSILGAGGLG